MAGTLPRPSGTTDQHLALLYRAIQETGITSPSKLVLTMVEDAARVLADGPDKERGWLASGRFTTWRIPIGMSYREAREAEKLRVLCNMSVGDAMRPVRTDRGSEDAEIILEWLRWTLDDKRGPDLFKAASIIAQGDKRGIALRLWMPGRGKDRKALYQLRQRIADRILAGLMRQGIDLRTMLAPADLAA